MKQQYNNLKESRFIHWDFIVIINIVKQIFSFLFSMFECLHTSHLTGGAVFISYWVWLGFYTNCCLSALTELSFIVCLVANNMFFYSMVVYVHLRQWYRWTVGTYEGLSLTWYNHCLWRILSPDILHCAVVYPHNVIPTHWWVNGEHCLVGTINRIN